MNKTLAVLSFSRDIKRVGCLFLSTALLSACGGTGQDDGSVSEFEQRFGGLALDGNVARATVYIDSNNDGRRNSWESFAFTDDEGFYSVNPNSGVDYCADTATENQRQYCLRTSIKYSDLVIRIEGGYDVITGEPFLQQMSRRLQLNTDADVSDTLVTPLTTLVTDVTDSSDRNFLLQSVGISESDLDVNYLNANGNGEVNTRLLNTALKVHKVVTVMSDRLTDTYNEIGDELGTPSDASSVVYSQLAREIVSSQTGLDGLLNNNTQILRVMNNAEDDLRNIYRNRELDVPADMGDESNPQELLSGANRVVQVANVVNRLFDANNNNVNVVGSSKALETIVIKTVNETLQDNSIDNAVNFFTDSSSSNLVDALTDALSGSASDIPALVQNDFTGDDFDSEEEIQAASQLPQDVLPFTEIGGLQVKISDLDLGYAPSDLQDREVEFYFSGEPDDISGRFSACVKYIDGASVDGTLGKGNTRGELISGFWSLLGTSDNNIESYSLLFTVNFLETTYQAIMKPAGGETVNDQQYQRLRFDFDGEVRAWHSENGFTALQNAPTSDAECQARLPSRIGL
ncbi:hypothetical protein TDB9533_02100 [Thalassocella blandensis]|nr:hypothetical protein TDB9533_02100 [Thalassocella blandensis]